MTDKPRPMWKHGVKRLPSAIITILLLPVIAREYFSAEAGAEYGIGFRDKLILLLKMVRNNIRVTSSSNFIYHLVMAGKILRLPKSMPGVLVECGCYKGGSAVNLSLLASACGRRLHLFDSFSGLPAPEGIDNEHLVLSEMRVRTYASGAYAGSLEEVRENLSRYGDLTVCEFHPGYFHDTLPGFHDDVAFAYIDADLVDSVRDCLRYLWPRLQWDSYLFTDEAHHNRVAELFFDRSWWASEVQSEPPGLVGAGNGIGLLLRPGGFRSSLGYTVKVQTEQLSRLPG
jgi:O-methyltransferase